MSGKIHNTNKWRKITDARNQLTRIKPYSFHIKQILFQLIGDLLDCDLHYQHQNTKFTIKKTG